MKLYNSMIFQVFHDPYKPCWGICASYFIKDGQDSCMKELYHLAIEFGVQQQKLLAQLRCIYIFFSISKCRLSVEPSTLHVTINNLLVHWANLLIYMYTTQ